MVSLNDAPVLEYHSGMIVCIKTYGFFDKKVRQRANIREFAPNRTFFGEKRYTFEHNGKTTVDLHATVLFSGQNVHAGE